MMECWSNCVTDQMTAVLQVGVGSVPCPDDMNHGVQQYVLRGHEPPSPGWRAANQRRSRRCTSASGVGRNGRARPWRRRTFRAFRAFRGLEGCQSAASPLRRYTHDRVTMAKVKVPAPVTPPDGSKKTPHDSSPPPRSHARDEKVKKRGPGFDCSTAHRYIFGRPRPLDASANV